MAEIIYDCDLVQHVSVPTHQRNGLLDLVITVSDGAHISCTDIEDLGISDHFLIITHLRMELSRPTSTTFDFRNIKYINVNVFRSTLLSSVVYTLPKPGTNDYAVKFCDCISGILDELKPVRRMTKRCGKPTSRWLSSEAIV